MSDRVVLPSRVLKRAPVSLAGAELAELGSVLEVETPTARLTFPRGRVVLGWDPRSRSLVLLEGARRGKPEPAPRGKAARSYEAWSDRDAKHLATLSIDPRGKWRSVGPVRRVDYASKKWTGREREYTHETGRGVRLYVHGSLQKPPRVWVIRGGRLTVTARGIVG